MNLLWQVLQHPVARAIGWALLDSLWQVTLIGALFGLSRLAARRATANARYVVGCLFLALALAAPVLSLCYRSRVGPGALVNPRLLAQVTPNLAVSAETAAFELFRLPDQTFSLLQTSADFLGRLTPLLAGAWLTGVLLSVLRLAHGCWGVRQIRTQSNEPVNTEWRQKLDDLRLRLGVSRPVLLLKSNLVNVPTVLGWLRPLILLPAASLTGLEPAQLEAILAHELAHIRRLDYLVNAFQCLVETLMFYHPVIWWISTCVREERENCCDDLVLAVCEDRLAYARALANLAHYRADAAQWAFAASGGPLLKRIRRLLGTPADRTRVDGRRLSGLTLCGLGVIFIALGIYWGLTPKAYQATARLRALSAPSRTTPAAGGQTMAESYDPYLSQTEFEMIRSPAVLIRVITNLNLDPLRGRQDAHGLPPNTRETMRWLNAKLGLRPIHNTSLIEISALGQTPDEAARLVNAWAAAAQRFGQEERERADAPAREAQEEVDRLRLALHIPDQIAEDGVTTRLLTAESLRRIEDLRVENQAEIARQETMLARLKQLQRELGTERMAEAIPTAVQDLLLSGLLEQRNLVEQKLALVQREYGPAHMEVIQAVSQVENLKSRIRERVEGILLGMEAKIASMQAGLQNLEKEAANARSNDIAQARSWRPYFEAKRRLERVLAAKRQENVVPSLSALEVVDAAVPPMRPVYPAQPRASACLAIGVLLEIAGALLLRVRHPGDVATNPA